MILVVLLVLAGAVLVGGESKFTDVIRDITERKAKADLALYAAKAAGRNTVKLFDPSMETEAESQKKCAVGVS